MIEVKFSVATYIETLTAGRELEKKECGSMMWEQQYYEFCKSAAVFMCQPGLNPLANTCLKFREFEGLRPMPPTPSASGVCIGAGCKAAGCKAAGLQAAGLRAAGVKAARGALQAAGL